MLLIIQTVYNQIVIKCIINKETVADEEERLYLKKRSKGKKDEDKLRDDMIMRAIGFIAKKNPPDITPRAIIAGTISYTEMG